MLFGIEERDVRRAVIPPDSVPVVNVVITV
jgi:hypothetical protein